MKQEWSFDILACVMLGVLLVVGFVIIISQTTSRTDSSGRGTPCTSGILRGTVTCIRHEYSWTVWLDNMNEINQYTTTVTGIILANKPLFKVGDNMTIWYTWEIVEPNIHNEWAAVATDWEMA